MFDILCRTHPSPRRNLGSGMLRKDWIPAFAGMTILSADHAIELKLTALTNHVIAHYQNIWYLQLAIAVCRLVFQRQCISHFSKRLFGDDEKVLNIGFSDDTQVAEAKGFHPEHFSRIDGESARVAVIVQL